MSGSALSMTRQRIKASGLVGELVIPYEELGVIGAGLDRQFARTPYTVSFSADPKAFTLVTLHVIYGKGAGARRRPKELKAIAEWLAARASDRDEFNRNLIALGTLCGMVKSRRHVGGLRASDR